MFRKNPNNYSNKPVPKEMPGAGVSKPSIEPTPISARKSKTSKLSLPKIQRKPGKSSPPPSTLVIPASHQKKQSSDFIAFPSGSQSEPNEVWEEPFTDSALPATTSKHVRKWLFLFLGIGAMVSVAILLPALRQIRKKNETLSQTSDPAPSSIHAKPVQPDSSLANNQALLAEYEKKIIPLIQSNDTNAIHTVLNQLLEQKDRSAAFYIGAAIIYRNLIRAAPATSLPTTRPLIEPVLEKALTLAPGDLGVLEFTADYFLEITNTQKALEILQTAYRLYPTSNTIRQRLLFVLIALDKRTEAFELSKEWVRQSPANTDVRAILMQFYLEDNDISNAIDHLKILLRLDSENRTYPMQWVQLMHRLQRDTEAGDFLKKLIDQESRNDEVYYAYSITCVERKQWEEVIRALDKMLEINPKTENPYQGTYGMALVQLGRMQEAEAYYRKLLLKENKYTPDIQNNLAWLLIEQNKNLEDAQVLIRFARRARPDFAPYLDTEGMLYFKQGNYREALASFQKAVNLGFKNSEVYLHLGDTYQILGQSKQALQAWKNGLVLSPNHEQLRSRIPEP